MKGARAGAHACPVCGSVHGVGPNTHTHISLSPPPVSRAPTLRCSICTWRSLGAGAAAPLAPGGAWEQAPQSTSLIQSFWSRHFLPLSWSFSFSQKRQTCEHFQLRSARTRARMVTQGHGGHTDYKAFVLGGWLRVPSSGPRAARASCPPAASFATLTT